MSCDNYIQRLLKLHGWDKDSLNLLPPDMLPTCTLNSGSVTVDASDNVATQVACNNNNFASIT